MTRSPGLGCGTRSLPQAPPCSLIYALPWGVFCLDTGCPPVRLALTRRKGRRKPGTHKSSSPFPTSTTSPAAHRHAREAAEHVLAEHEEHERQIQQAVDGLRTLPPFERNVPKLLRKLKLQHLCRQTVWRRLTGQTRPAQLAQEKGMLLPLATELVLVEWIKHMGRQGKGFSRTGIRARAMQLGALDKMPGTRWLALFEKRHPDVDFHPPRSLAPSRAQAFNRHVVSGHFTNIKEAMDGVEVSLMFNGDEMGLQRGGGRKCLGKHVAFASDDTVRYQQRSDNLELTTIIDVVCADGTLLVPGFVFAGKNMYEDNWFKHDCIYIHFSSSLAHLYKVSHSRKPDGPITMLPSGGYVTALVHKFVRRNQT
jgi:hypothetical protein